LSEKKYSFVPIIIVALIAQDILIWSNACRGLGLPVDRSVFGIFT